MSDYWTLTNGSYQAWKRAVAIARLWSHNLDHQMMSCRAQTDYVIYAALEQYQINHGNRKA